jgi:hypothetical protein
MLPSARKTFLMSPRGAFPKLARSFFFPVARFFDEARMLVGGTAHCSHDASIEEISERFLLSQSFSSSDTCRGKGSIVCASSCVWQDKKVNLMNKSFFPLASRRRHESSHVQFNHNDWLRWRRRRKVVVVDLMLMISARLINIRIITCT